MLHLTEQKIRKFLILRFLFKYKCYIYCLLTFNAILYLLSKFILNMVITVKIKLLFRKNIIFTYVNLFN